MYSLRSQSCTAFFEEKAISVVDFFFMKKEEGYATNRSAVSYALLNNCKKVQHKNVIFPFMMLDIFDAVLKEARNSYYNLTKEVYISQSNFRKLSNQTVGHLEKQIRNDEFNKLFSMMIKLLNKRNSVNGKNFGKSVKLFICTGNSYKDHSLYQEFRNKFDKLQSFCVNRNIILRSSERINESVAENLQLTAKKGYIDAFYPLKTDCKEKRDLIINSIFNDIEINVFSVKEIEKIKNEEVIALQKVLLKKGDLTTSEKDLNRKEMVIPVELGNYLDDLAIKLNNKQKSENMARLQESLLKKSKKKILGIDYNPAQANGVLRYEVHTDASLNVNKAGFGAVVCQQNRSQKKVLMKMAGMKRFNTESSYSIQIAELLAISSIIKHLTTSLQGKEQDILCCIFSDNQDCVNALQGKNIWNENGEIKKIINEIKQSPIRLTYQFEKGHSNNKWNNVAHKLSRVGRGFNEEKFINVSA